MKKHLTFALALAVAVSAAGAAYAGNKGSDHVEPNRHFDMWFDKMDANNDGVVSIAEHAQFSEKMYWKADANRDRVITREEAWQAKKHWKDVNHKYWEGKDARSLNEVNE